MMFLTSIHSMQTQKIQNIFENKLEVPQKAGAPEIKFDEMVRTEHYVDQHVSQMKTDTFLAIQEKLNSIFSINHRKNLSNLDKNNIETKLKKVVKNQIEIIKPTLGTVATDLIKKITLSLEYERFIADQVRDLSAGLSSKVDSNERISQVNNFPPVDQSIHLKTTQSATNRGLSAYSSKVFIQPEGRPLRKADAKEKPIVNDNDHAIKSYLGDPLGKNPNQKKSFDASA